MYTKVVDVEPGINTRRSAGKKERVKRGKNKREKFANFFFFEFRARTINHRGRNLVLLNKLVKGTISTKFR